MNYLTKIIELTKRITVLKIISPQASGLNTITVNSNKFSSDTLLKNLIMIVENISSLDNHESLNRINEALLIDCLENLDNNDLLKIIFSYSQHIIDYEELKNKIIFLNSVHN